MNAHVKNKLKMFRRLDRKGGIEGLPMELMIIIIVATLGTAILIGWMGNIEEPKTIGNVESSVDSFVLTSASKSNLSLNVTVTDAAGDGIEGATVYLSGCNVSKTGNDAVYAVTDSNGVAKFTGLTVTKSTQGVGYINATVSSADYGEDSSLKIPVVR